MSRYLELCTLGDLLVRGSEHHPGRDALVLPGVRLSYRELGFVGADGRLRYLGRLKDMLKEGGENVAALEIASRLQAHPAVSVAQVVGVADEKYGEVPAAFIELKPGMAVSEEEVIAHCRAGLATFKVPRHVRFVTQWPMSSTKVQTFRLREQLEAELARRGGQRPS